MGIQPNRCECVHVCNRDRREEGERERDSDRDGDRVRVSGVSINDHLKGCRRNGHGEVIRDVRATRRGLVHDEIPIGRSINQYMINVLSLTETSQI